MKLAFLLPVLVLGTGLSSPFAPPAGADAAAAPKTVLDEASGISETVYPNGLTLLVKPQPDNPVVTCMIWYAVGSRDEGVGETGLSHYLEHMLFKGTDRYPKGAIDRITQLGGGSNNASTRSDATEYHFTFPADTWEVALEIESNRMRNSDCKPEEFEAEKKVVLNELWIGLDDPADVLYEKVHSALFVAGRYHHPVIGWQEDVESTTRERMMKYYLKHYTPDRATLVVVGGADRARTIARVGELFGPIPRGTESRFEMKEPKTLGETRLTLVQDTQVARLLLAFRSLPVLHPDEPVLDVLSSILAGDKTSRLERALVDTGLAASAECWSDTRRDDGAFVIQAQPAGEHTLEELEAGVRAVLKEVATAGVTADEVARAKAKLQAERIFGAETSSGLASRLGSVAVLGDWRYHLRYPARIDAVTPDAVKTAAASVFTLDRLVVGRSLPKPEAAADSAPAGSGAGAGAAPEAEKRADGAGDKGLRSARYRGGEAAPAAAASAAIGRALTLEPVRKVLPNGLTVLVLRRGAAPICSASLQVTDGRLGEAVPGLDAMTSALLEEGTTVRSGADIAAAIGAVGGSLSFAGASVSSKTLSKDAGLAFELLAEVVSKPAFAPEALERVREQQLARIAEELDTPRSVAEAMFRRAVYGPTHPLGRSASGTPESVKGITRDRIVAHHARFVVPKNATLAVVCDRDPAEVLGLVEQAFGGWAGGERPVVETPAIPAPAARTMRRPVDANQANLYVGHVGIERKDPDFAALEVFDNIFGTGAGFTSRLAMNVRDQKGLAYSVWGNVTSSAGIRPGLLRVFAGTKPSDWPVALKEMRAELAGMLERPATEEELAGAKAAIRGDTVTKCEAGADLASLLLTLERFGLGFDWPKRYLEEVSKITADDVIRAAKAHVHPDRVVELVVAPGLTAQGLDAEPAK